MSQYAVILICSGIIPLILSLWPPLGIYRHWKALVVSLGSVIAVFGTWDIYAVSRGHWFFDPDGVFPFRFINLPLEEALFFVVIPFCCIFTWEAVIYLTKRIPFQSNSTGDTRA